MLDNAGGYLLCMLVGIRSACWWVSALYAPMLVAYLLCTVLDNAGGVSACWTKHHAAPCLNAPCCMLVGICSAR